MSSAYKQALYLIFLFRVLARIAPQLSGSESSAFAIFTLPHSGLSRESQMYM